MNGKVKSWNPFKKCAICNMVDRNETLKLYLLEKYSKKEPKVFLQIDIWKQDGPDSDLIPDKNGLVLHGKMVAELRNTDSLVRVQIHESAKPADVIKGFEEAKKFLKEEGCKLLFNDPFLF